MEQNGERPGNAKDEGQSLPQLHEDGKMGWTTRQQVKMVKMDSLRCRDCRMEENRSFLE